MTSDDSAYTIRADAICKSYSLHGMPAIRLAYTLLRGRSVAAGGFEALRNVSFRLRKGEVLGVVGKNGSGKSTLLQIICGIIEPDSGSVEVDGRIGTLLELGSGLAPELSGIDNVWMSLGVMGVHSSLIAGKIRQITEFADIGGFIGRPVSTYSSGMILRLAFSIALAQDSDIIIIDEVIAVGDEAFQRKCFGAIKDTVSRGGSVILVSHSAQLIVELCDRAILLDKGTKLMDGAPRDVVAQYHRLLYAPAGEQAKVRAAITGLLQAAPDQPGEDARIRSEHYDPELVCDPVVYESKAASISGVRLTSEAGDMINIVNPGNEYIFAYKALFHERAYAVRFGTAVKTVTGIELGGYSAKLSGMSGGEVVPGTSYDIMFRFRANLTPGVYFFNAGIMGHDSSGSGQTFLARHVDTFMFRVAETQTSATGYVDFDFTPEIRC